MLLLLLLGFLAASMALNLPTKTWYLSQNGHYVSEYNKPKPGKYKLHFLFTYRYHYTFEIDLYENLTSSVGRQILGPFQRDGWEKPQYRYKGCHTSVQIERVKLLPDNYTLQFTFRMVIQQRNREVVLLMETTGPDAPTMLQVKQTTGPNVLVLGCSHTRVDTLPIAFRKPPSAAAATYFPNYMTKWIVSVYVIVNKNAWKRTSYASINSKESNLKTYLEAVFRYANWLSEPVGVAYSLDGLRVFKERNEASWFREQNFRPYVAQLRANGTIKASIDMTLMIDWNFPDNKVGSAYRDSCCRGWDSVLRTYAHFANVAARVFVHEAFHTFGLRHTRCSQSSVMMAGGFPTAYNDPVFCPSSYTKMLRIKAWSPRLAYLMYYHSKPFYGPLCGNNILEKGEECDTGMGATSYKTCCDPLTCRFKNSTEYCGGYESLPQGGPFRCSGESAYCGPVTTMFN